MQVIVLLDQSLVFLLERDEGLCVKLGLLSNYCAFVLKLLECLRCLNDFIQKALYKRCRFDV